MAKKAKNYHYQYIVVTKQQSCQKESSIHLTLTVTETLQPCGGMFSWATESDPRSSSAAL